ncbi:hypothetical protein CHS0354_020099 [Potamilus streckersoni]|uniref:Uncharacterized protein n=1 Tax=Potamilus streckersoni TaxID=2493646 RepID=A0AAE0VP42_9BIVA|nr:hypothetical protein CHS0354_020099 [Potamilus streckersoni]
MRQRRVKEIEIETPTVKQDDIDVSKEQWRREAKTSQTKPRYFSPPKEFPTPKKGNVKDVKSTKRPSDNIAQVLEGGKTDPVLDILQEKMHLLLAVTDEKVVHSVDDILDIIQGVPDYRDIEVDEQQDPFVLRHDLLARMHDVKYFEPSTLRYDHQCITCGEAMNLSNST